MKLVHQKKLYFLKGNVFQSSGYVQTIKIQTYTVVEHKTLTNKLNFKVKKIYKT